MKHSTLVLAALSVTGCITPDQPEPVPPDTPITLHAPARALLGTQPEEILVETSDTVANFPLDSQLFRTVAQNSGDAVVSI